MKVRNGRTADGRPTRSPEEWADLGPAHQTGVHWPVGMGGLGVVKEPGGRRHTVSGASEDQNENTRFGRIFPTSHGFAPRVVGSEPREVHVGR